MIDVKNLDADIRSILDGFTLPQNQSIRLAFTVLVKHLNAAFVKQEIPEAKQHAQRLMKSRQNAIRDHIREVAFQRGFLQDGDMMLENFITDIANEIVKEGL